jgi:hypothetical protein
MRQPRSDFGAIVLHNRIFVLGGLNGGVPTDSVEAYDPATMTWNACSAMRQPGANLDVVASGGRLLFFREQVPEIYDPTTDSWEILSVTLRQGLPRSCTCTVPCGEYVYVLGGVGPNSSGMARWSIGGGSRIAEGAISGFSWSPQVNSASRMCVVDGRLYVISRNETSNTMAQYEPERDEWTALPPPLSFGRKDFRIVVVGGAIYVLGGLSLAHRFSNGKWTKLPKMQTRGNCLVAAAVIAID